MRVKYFDAFHVFRLTKLQELSNGLGEAGATKTIILVVYKLLRIHFRQA